MKTSKLLYQIIALFEQLEAENEGRELSLADFAGFLNSHLALPSPSVKPLSTPFGNADRPAVDVADMIDNNIGRLLSFISRYAKFYIKKALEATPLLSVEDFSCLGILLTHENMSQSELIMLNIQEKTSGVQVIRRLIDAGLAKQWDDPKDKRGKRIAITNKGKKLLYEIFEDTSNVGKIVTGPLTMPEKLNLLYLLRKLDDYHKLEYEGKTVQTKADLKKTAERVTASK